MMDLSEYKKKALRTDYKDYSDYHGDFISPRLEYGVVGLVTESAKALDILKKSKKNLKPLDTAALQEELSDLLWYLNLTLDELDVSFETLMQLNLDKIAKKYPAGENQTLIRGD